MTIPGLSSGDLDLLRRLTIVTILGFLFAAGFVHLRDVYSHKFFDVTGRAVWIWPRIDITRGNPVVFFATRDFDLPANRYYTHVKVAADPEYTLYFNGREIAGRRFGDDRTLDVYDLTQLARTGRNRIVVAVRATRGVGGLLASVDISPETANLVVTDAAWNIAMRWSPELLDRDLPGMRKPMVIGEPPAGKWNYLRPRTAAIEPPPSGVRMPGGSFPYVATMPVVKVVNGTAIVTSQQEPATAFDFGDIDARLRVVRAGAVNLPQLVEVRFANTREELGYVEGGVRTYAFAPGERLVVDPETRRFRYVGIYRSAATADALLNR